MNQQQQQQQQRNNGAPRLLESRSLHPNISRPEKEYAVPSNQQPQESLQNKLARAKAIKNALQKKINEKKQDPQPLQGGKRKTRRNRKQRHTTKRRR